MEPNQSFVMELLRQAPELTEMYAEHMADYDELLAHLFFGDVVRFIIDICGREESRDLPIRILNHLEMGLVNGDSEVDELIVVSFAENLYGENVTLERLKPLMGPRLLDIVKEICE